GRRGKEMCGHLARDRQILGERLALPAQHVGTVRDEPLILDEPRRPAGAAWKVCRRDWPLPVRGRRRRGGHVTFEAGIARRRVLHPERALWAEIHPPLRGPRFRRPRVPLAPGVAASFEGLGLGSIQTAFVLEEMREPRRLDLVTKIHGRVSPERDRTEAVAFA